MTAAAAPLKDGSIIGMDAAYAVAAVGRGLTGARAIGNETRNVHSASVRRPASIGARLATRDGFPGCGRLRASWKGASR